MTVKVYSKAGCPNCVSLKKALERLGVGYEEVRVDYDSEAMALLVNEGFRSVPVLELPDGTRRGSVSPAALPSVLGLAI